MKILQLLKNKAPQWYDVKAKSDDVAEVYIYDVIGEDFWGEGVSAKDFVKEINALKDVKTLIVHINSPGGQVPDGLAIHNALLNHPAHVEVQIDGWAASAASFIALAGDTVKMADNAFFMIHDPWSVVMGNAAEMRETAAWLDQQKENLVNIYVKHSNLNREEVAQAMSNETWYNAEDALAAGFIDEISTGKKAAASAFYPDLFKNMPKALKNQICGCHNQPKPATEEPDPTASNPEKKQEVESPKAENTDVWRSQITNLYKQSLNKV